MSPRVNRSNAFWNIRRDFFATSRHQSRHFSFLLRAIGDDLTDADDGNRHAQADAKAQIKVDVIGKHCFQGRFAGFPAVVSIPAS